MHPLLVKKILFPAHEWLLGKRTLARLFDLDRTQWLAPAALEEYRFERLRRLLEYAYAYVPYYRRVFDEHEVPPRRVQSFSDLRRVPYLTREMVRAHQGELRPRVPVRGARPFSTGGSTGSPVTVFIDMERMAFSDASRLRAHRWFGLEIGVREIALWGSVRDLSRQGALRVLRDRLLNYRTLSAFDLGERALGAYARLLDRFRPAKIYGYASAITLLSQYLSRRGLTRAARSLRAVFSTAEPLFGYQRALIREGLGCVVAEEYGSRDAGLIANECPAGGLHVNAEGIHAEVLGPSGEAGELVITNFDTPAMPIIRYRTQDIGVLGRAGCRCGRTLPVLAGIQGRSTDFLVTPDGRVLHALAAIYILREIPGVQEFQILQESLNRVIVHVVPCVTFGEGQLGAIRAAMQGLMGPGVLVDVVSTSCIDRPVSGKHRYVISAVADAYLGAMLERVAR
ncbi:MAG: phenylacetate--CoA ligase family protein [Candidatus Rokubacteria bacterium]|nr:phenylacetate--CoA ligase family protein [Candidatus Rokubacteria bacterium]